MTATGTDIVGRKWTMKPGATPHTWRVFDPSGIMRISEESYTVASAIVYGCNYPGTIGGECGETARTLLGQRGGV